MLLAIDVGNTNITMAVFDKEKIVATFRITTNIIRTSDEYGLLILECLEHRDIKKENITDIIIASVVPDIMYSLNNGIIKYFGKQAIVVGPGVKTGIKLTNPNPKEIGADRIVDAVGAYGIYGGPVIVIDFGTATTFDYITEDGTFPIGVTAPGIRLSATALWQGAAKLPEIEIKKPDSILARETISSLQAGIVYGYIGLTEYIIDKMKEELGNPNIKVVATGGLGKIIADETKKIDVFDMELTMHGLRLIYEKNM